MIPEDKKIPRPSVKEVKIKCEDCSLEGTIFFTNREIWSNTKIKQNCKQCKKFTTWGITQ